MNKGPQDITYVENPDFETTNVVRSLGIALRASTAKRIVIIYGDLVFNDYALKFPIGDESVAVIDHYNSMMKDEVGCVIEPDERTGVRVLESMYYGLYNKWAQILYITGKELALFKSACWNPQNYNKFGFEIVNEVIDKGGSFKPLQPRKLKACDIDCPNDIARVRQLFRSEI